MINYKFATTIPELVQSFDIIKKLDQSYPEFKHWYYNKVIPGVSLGTDKVILAFHHGNLIGVSLIKSTETEKKLRALRIVDKYQNKGYGLHLIDRSLKELECDKPLASVSEDMLNYFSRIFINRYDFNMTYVHKGLYLPGKLEYQFNGLQESLKEKSIIY